jgi:hypothetical protein
MPPESPSGHYKKYSSTEHTRARTIQQNLTPSKPKYSKQDKALATFIKEHKVQNHQNEMRPVSLPEISRN